MYTKNTSLIVRASGLQKLVFCLGFSAIIYFIFSTYQLDKYSLIILTWDAFAISMVLVSWNLFLSTSNKDLCFIVKRQDDGLKVIFIIVIMATCISVLGTLILSTSKIGSVTDRVYHMFLTLSPVLLSWILLHTIFVVRYAHLYHDHNELETGSKISGIVFPGKTEPDYIDFAYFSFVIGMTFQVSDVVITSSVIRRFVLMHSIISFGFNTIIVALTINSIAGLKL